MENLWVLLLLSVMSSMLYGITVLVREYSYNGPEEERLSLIQGFDASCKALYQVGAGTMIFGLLILAIWITL